MMHEYGIKMKLSTFLMSFLKLLEFQAAGRLGIPASSEAGSGSSFRYPYSNATVLSAVLVLLIFDVCEGVNHMGLPYC